MINQQEKSILTSLVNFLLSNASVFAPTGDGGGHISKIHSFEEVNWSGGIPQDSWKQFLLPPTEKIFDFNKETPQEINQPVSKIVLLGVNVIDLKALSLFDLVFGGDVYYQRRRRNIIIVGYGTNWPNEYKKLKPFSHNYKEDVLEHVGFDIFIAQAGSDYKFYTGSNVGQELLDQNKLKHYEHIEFAGVIPEEGPDKRMLLLMEKVEKSAGNKIWKDLEKICIACGKCSIVCPTCYCFDFQDKTEKKQAGRERVWGNCFYNDFSKVAGGQKYLDNAGKKIFFWYFHKFVRVPFAYRLPGCVACGRCTKACPVGIDIMKNISQILKIK